MTRIFSLNFHILTPKLKFAMEEISMKATGIVRRIDDLGRVVVPKEIRRTLRIREGDPMEIFTNHDGEIILKKYSPIGEIEMFAKQYADVMAQVSGQRVLISDRDQIIYPIICEGDVIGSVIVLAKDENNKVSITEQKLAGVAAAFLGRQMES